MMQNTPNPTTNDDPLALCNIPHIIQGTDSEGNILLYRRDSLLGKGGFAKVFSGTLLPGYSQYALKIVSNQSLRNSNTRKQLSREINLHKSLRHVNIVQFERFFHDNSYCYIVMELCELNSMSKLLKREQRFSEADTRCYLLQVVDALRYLHDRLIIHRDLKLGNLFIDSNKVIKIGDFGFATKLTYADERRKTICGTPNYIAPEILEGKNGHSFEVDIWSTGVILYTLLVGKPPFQSKDVMSTYKRILLNNYDFPPEIPVCSDAKNLTHKILQSRPEFRLTLSEISEHPFLRTAHTSRRQQSSLLPDLDLQECAKKRTKHDPFKANYSYISTNSASDSRYKAQSNFKFNLCSA